MKFTYLMARLYLPTYVEISSNVEIRQSSFGLFISVPIYVDCTIPKNF